MCALFPKLMAVPLAEPLIMYSPAPKVTTEAPPMLSPSLMMYVPGLKVTLREFPIDKPPQ